MGNTLKDKKYCTVEEAIDAIISVFTQEQLKVLEIKNNSGKTLTFKKQLWAKYSHFYPVGNIEKIQIMTSIIISENPHLNKISLQFSSCFSVENSEKRDFEQNKEWKFNIAWKVLNSIIAISGFLIAIIK